MGTTVVGAIGGGPGTTVVGVPTPRIVKYGYQNGASLTVNYTVPAGISVVCVAYSPGYEVDNDGTLNCSIQKNGEVITSRTVDYFIDTRPPLRAVIPVQEGDTITIKSEGSVSGSDPQGGYVIFGI